MALFILMWDGRRQTVVPERYAASKKMSLAVMDYLNANAASASRHSEAN